MVYKFSIIDVENGEFILSTKIEVDCFTSYCRNIFHKDLDLFINQASRGGHHFCCEFVPVPVEQELQLPF